MKSRDENGPRIDLGRYAGTYGGTREDRGAGRRDNNGVFTGIAWALPLGLLVWALVWWWLI